MPVKNENTLEAISTVKGLFNRVARQDQWDWFTVRGQLGYPASLLSRNVGEQLGRLRSSIRDQRESHFREVKAALGKTPIRLCLSYFLGRLRIREEEDAGWIYLLSTRQSKTLLKIGMTTRSVEKRVQEINSATGVIIPFGVRECWRVRYPSKVEKHVHKTLSEFRIRDDREFFEAEFAKIVTAIQQVITDSGLEIKALDELLESHKQ